jgi:DNA-binding response OmpR family regulator
MRILIVEDNPSDQELLLEWLQEHFIQQAKFRVASDLKGAFDYLNRRHSSLLPGGVTADEPYFHCILLDLGLPDSNGRDTFRAIHGAHSHIPIVVVSNNPDQSLAVELIREGAEDFILKNFSDTNDLFRRILFAVERSTRDIKNQSRLSLKVPKAE